MGWRTKQFPEKLNPTPERSVSPWKLSVTLWTTNLDQVADGQPRGLVVNAGPA